MTYAADVQLSTPGDWVVVDADTAAQAGAMQRAVDERLAAHAELAQLRDLLTDNLQAALLRTQQDGVLLCAVLVDTDGPVLANLVLAFADRAPADVVAAATTPGTDDTEHPVERALAEADGEHVAQRDVHEVLLPGGPAVRVARVEELPLTEGGPTLRALTVEYLFTRRDLDHVVVLQFATPTVAHHERLQQLFHAIAETVRIIPAEDPAPPAPAA